MELLAAASATTAGWCITCSSCSSSWSSIKWRNFRSLEAAGSIFSRCLIWTAASSRFSRIFSGSKWSIRSRLQPEEAGPDSIGRRRFSWRRSSRSSLEEPASSAGASPAAAGRQELQQLEVAGASGASASELAGAAGVQSASSAGASSGTRIHNIIVNFLIRSLRVAGGASLLKLPLSSGGALLRYSVVSFGVKMPAHRQEQLAGAAFSRRLQQEQVEHQELAQPQQEQPE